MAVAWESGARPVVVLNKSDLVEEPESWRASIESVALGVPVLITSGVRGDGISILEDQLRPGETAAFVGSSGVGKSTLINALAGEERQRVAPVRTSDGRGRHSTTSRRLIALSGEAILIDTPGLREVQLGEGATGLARAFADVAALAAQCRFRDCRHEAEPGCAVLEAEAAGRIESERLESYRKLQRERGYLESRQNPAARAARLQKTKKLHKEQRRFYRERARDE
jgi:ribosome biogenesis GTPase